VSAGSGVLLVTGASGFVMASVARHLAQEAHQVVAVDVNPPDAALSRFWAGTPGHLSFRRLDVRDRAAVRALVQELRPSGAVHGAAITSIPEDAERRRFAETVDVNVGGALAVIEALAEAGCARIVAVSSGSVYGKRPDLAPIDEDADKDPRALYPMTKWAADMLTRRLAEMRGISLAVARLASPFGPLERDTGSRPLLSPIAAWTAAALRGAPMVVAGDPEAQRDAVYVEDVAGALASILLADRLPHDVYNVGWGRGASARQTVAALARVVPGARVEWRPDEPSPWIGAANQPRGPLRIERLTRDLGWAPRYDLDSGLAAFVDWLRKNP
jgi:nucleoside-diphosphate-sugar epimerase